MKPPARMHFVRGVKSEPRISITATLFPCPEGGFTAICNEIRGAISQGETKKEALENLTDAVKMILLAAADVADQKAKACAKSFGRGVQPIKSKLMELCEAR